MNGLDITIRQLEISARRDELVALMVHCQNELNDIAFEERELLLQQQRISANMTDKNIKHSLAYKAAYINEILDI